MTDILTFLTPIAAASGMTASLAGDGFLAMGDWETQHVITHEDDRFAVGRVDRGSRTVDGTFSDEAGAARWMLAIAASSWRATHGLTGILPAEMSRTIAETTSDGTIRLTFAGGWASFPAGFSGGGRARTFSHIASASLEEIWAAYQHPTGKPLFRGQA